MWGWLCKLAIERGMLNNINSVSEREARCFNGSAAPQQERELKGESNPDNQHWLAAHWRHNTQEFHQLQFHHRWDAAKPPNWQQNRS